MWRVLMATALVTVVLGAISASGALLTVHPGQLAVFTYPVSLASMAATVDIDPDSLQLRSKGQPVTVYIELPEGYDVADIDVSTVILEVEDVDGGSLPAELSPTEVADHDADGIPDRMVKFSREAVVTLLDGRTGDIAFRVSGEVSGNTFEGTDTVRVLDSHGGGEDTESALPEESPEESPAPPAVGPAPLPTPTMEYQVQPGDTLIDIAARFGTTVEALVELNRMQDPNVILYGSMLNVPYAGEELGDAIADASP